MNLSVRFESCLLLSLALASSRVLPAAEAEFVALSNGRDLTGWTLEGSPADSFVAEAGSILCTGKGNYPTWLRSDREYENFVLRLEYQTIGWTEAGILLHAPRYGRASRAGLKIHIRHDRHPEGARTAGSIYDVEPPKVRVNKPSGQWNQLEVRVDWPRFRATLNEQVIHDLDMEEHPLLRHRLRRGHLGLQAIGTRIRYRAIRIRELPSREVWTPLSNGTDLSGWERVGPARWSVEEGRIVGFDGDGYLVTKDRFDRYKFQVFVRTSAFANGGLHQRWQSSRQKGYEIQIYNVIEATNPTGSIYGRVPARDPDVRDGEWFLLEFTCDGPTCRVQVNGELVAEAADLELPPKGQIALQMHKRGARIEFLDPKVCALGDRP